MSGTKLKLGKCTLNKKNRSKSGIFLCTSFRVGVYQHKNSNSAKFGAKKWLIFFSEGGGGIYRWEFWCHSLEYILFIMNCTKCEQREGKRVLQAQNCIPLAQRLICIIFSILTYPFKLLYCIFLIITPLWCQCYIHISIDYNGGKKNAPFGRKISVFSTKNYKLILKITELWKAFFSPNHKWLAKSDLVLSASYENYILVSFSLLILFSKLTTRLCCWITNERPPMIQLSFFKTNCK